MPYLTDSRAVQWFCLSIGLPLFAFSIFRAANLSFTIDESHTYLEFVCSPLWDIVSFKETSANNHILNSVLMKCTATLFGQSELSLRLPNVMAHAVYQWYAFLLLKRICSRGWLVVCGFAMLNCNPFLLDFFSLARGYGLSVAFAMGGIYHLLRSARESRGKHAALSMAFGLFAVLGNFSLLTFYASMLVVLSLVFFSRAGSFVQWLKHNAWPAAITLLLVAVSYEPVRKMAKFGALYDGGTQGIWADTVHSLIESSNYGQKYPTAFTVFAVAVIAVVLISQLGIVITLLRKGREHLAHPSLILFVLLLGPVFCSVLQHLLLHSNYPANRMALFYLPLFFLNFIAALDLFAGTRARPAAMVLGAITTLVFVGHTVASLNLHSTHLWGFNADTKTMLSDLEQQRGPGKNKVTLGSDWMLKSPVLFYVKTHQLDWLHVQDLDEQEANCDIYYLYDADHDLLDRNTKQVLNLYPQSGTVLLKD